MSLEQTINQDSDLFKSFVNEGDPEADLEITNEVPVVTDVVELPSDELEITTQVPEDTEDTTEEVTTEETEDTEQEEIPEDTESYSYKAFAKYLSDEGIVEFEDNEDLPDTPDVLFESVKKTIAKEIDNYKASIPTKAKEIIEYLEKGGDIDKYLNTLQKPFNIKELDLSSESDQESIVREFLKSQEYSQEEINETITDYKESLLLEKQAAIASKNLEKVFAKREQNLLSEQENLQEIQKQQYVEYVTGLQNTIDNATELAGLPLTEKEKKDFKIYLLAVDKEGKTQYEKEIAAEPKTPIELAYLKFTKYDFSKARKAGETAATQKLKNIFKKNEVVPKSAKAITADNTDSDLSAFDVFRRSIKTE